MAPSTKVTMAMFVGALTTILVWAVGRFAHIEVPPEVAAAVTIVLGALFAYLVPERNPAPSARETLIERGELVAPPRG